MSKNALSQRKPLPSTLIRMEVRAERGKLALAALLNRPKVKVTIEVPDRADAQTHAALLQLLSLPAHEVKVKRVREVKD